MQGSRQRRFRMGTLEGVLSSLISAVGPQQRERIFSNCKGHLLSHWSTPMSLGQRAPDHFLGKSSEGRSVSYTHTQTRGISLQDKHHRATIQALGSPMVGWTEVEQPTNSLVLTHVCTNPLASAPSLGFGLANVHIEQWRSWV